MLPIEHTWAISTATIRFEDKKSKAMKRSLLREIGGEAEDDSDGEWLTGEENDGSDGPDDDLKEHEALPFI
jgi:hypothetical protein